MYTLEQLNTRPIWLFKETRSGSSWFMKQLIKNLNRRDEAVPKIAKNQGRLSEEEIKEIFRIRSEQADNIPILHSHHSEGLLFLSSYPDPIIFRHLRRNKTEQFISSHIANISKVWNVESSKDYDLYPKIEPFVIPTRTTKSYIDKLLMNEDRWVKYATSYENETIYYEDLVDGWQSKILPFYMKMEPTYSTNNTHTFKLPYNKRELVINYDEIDYHLKLRLGSY